MCGSGQAPGSSWPLPVGTLLTLGPPAEGKYTMNYDEFLSLGVQLLPVLWVVVAIETKWLKTKANERGTNRRISNTAFLITMGFPAAGAAILLALIAILANWEVLKLVASSYLLACLVVSIFTTVMSLLRTLYDYMPIHDPE